MLGLLLSLTLHADPLLQTSLEAAVAVPSARVELLGWRGPPCQGRYEAAPVTASGRVAVRVRGAGCDEWGWATGEDHHARRSAEPGGEDRRRARRRLGAQRSRAQPIGAPARHRGLGRHRHAGHAAGRRLVGPRRFDKAPRQGRRSSVRVVAGAVAVEERGLVAACTGPAACATLPSGKRVRGHIEDGTLVVSAPGGSRL